MKTETKKFEIKFRGQRLDNGEMVFGYLVKDENGNCYIFNYHFIPNLSIPTRHFIKVIPETVGQFMNFQDKKKVDVYFDDIVMDERGRIMRVGYFNYRYCLIAITETNFHHANFFDWMWEDQVIIEIIGNIHQNPELLNVKKVK